jgi:hypothetical protein
MYQTCQFEHCRKEFSRKGKRKFCSRTCSNLARWNADSLTGRTIHKTCEQCGKEWTTTRSESYRRGYKTCSNECRVAAIKEKLAKRVFSNETRERMSQSQREKTLTPEHRRKIGKAVAGPRNKHWIDGRSYEKDDYAGLFTESLKMIVKERDNSACQECNLSSCVVLVVHHIDGVKLNNDVDNLTTLCQSCHSIIHTNIKYVPKNKKLKVLVKKR